MDCRSDWPAHFLTGSNSNNPLAVIPGLFYSERHVTVAVDCAAEGARKGYAQTCAQKLTSIGDKSPPYVGCVDKDATPCSAADICTPAGEVMQCEITTRGYLTSREMTRPCPASYQCHPDDELRAVCIQTPWTPCDPKAVSPVCSDPVTLTWCRGTADAGYVQESVSCAPEDAGVDAGYRCEPPDGGERLAHCTH